MTVYAKWTINKYTVTFNTNGGSSVEKQQVEYQGKAIKPNNPTKNKYTFVNWYEDIGLTKVFNFDNKITNDITLYASWKYNGGGGNTGGGSLGKAVISRLLEENIKAEIIALGTNSTATQNMIKGNNIQGATGENPVVVNSIDADIIIGPIGILTANSMLGEITEKMTMAISKSRATKLLIPYNKCKVIVAGVKNDTFQNYINEVVDYIKKIAN